MWRGGWQRSYGELATFAGKPGSLTQAGLINQVDLGDSETPADLLCLGEKAPAWGWEFRKHMGTLWALKEDCSKDSC